MSTDAHHRAAAACSPPQPAGSPASGLQPGPGPWQGSCRRPRRGPGLHWRGGASQAGGAQRAGRPGRAPGRPARPAAAAAPAEAAAARKLAELDLVPFLNLQVAPRAARRPQG